MAEHFSLLFSFFIIDNNKFSLIIVRNLGRINLLIVTSSKTEIIIKNILIKLYYFQSWRKYFFKLAMFVCGTCKRQQKVLFRCYSSENVAITIVSESINQIWILPIAGNELISAFATGEAFLMKYRSTRPHYQLGGRYRVAATCTSTTTSKHPETIANNVD